MHAGEDLSVVAAVRGARLPIARSWSGLLTVARTTGRRVGGSSRVATVVGTVVGAGRIVSAVVHGTTTGGHVWVASSKSTIASVHLLCVLLSLCPRGHTVGCLRSIGWQLMRESEVTVFVVALRCVIATATW